MGGHSLGGAIFGKSKDDTSGGDAQKNLSRLSQILFKESTPLRREFLDRGMNAVSGNLDVTNLPGYAALKDATDIQFKRARDNIIASSGAGGGLSDLLANAEMAKASGMAQGTAGLYSDELARAFAQATGTAPTALSGMSNSANALSQIQSAQMGQNAAAAQGLGMAAGRYMGSKSGSSAGSAASSGSKAGSAAAAA